MMMQNTKDKVNITFKDTDPADLQSTEQGFVPIQTPDDTIATEEVGETRDMATTQFVDDDVMVSRDESHVAHVDTIVTSISNTQATQENIIDFLKKPIILTTSTFSTTDTFSIFNSYSMPYSVLISDQGAIWRAKLAGFFGIRMDMRFRLVVNGNKFQQGRYIMGWTPTGGSTKTVSNLKNINFIYSHNATLVQRTTVPHVEIDLGSQSVAELLVPFMSVNNFYPFNTILASNDYSSLGYLNVYPYDAMQSPTGSTTCGYTVYVSFENVSLFGAASAQAGIKFRKDKEVTNKQNGPISGVASAVSRGFKEFKSIPLMGEFAGSVSWIADRIASTASIFGFSKPTAGDVIPKMMILNAPTHSNVDGDSDARSLSYLNKPGTVAVKGLSGTDYDEMDFSYLKSRYAWFKTASWTLLLGAGATVTTVDVRPSSGVISTTVNSQTNVSYTPVGFIAAQFQWWRGSLKFRFKLVKTEYHSGRLQFAFYPTDEANFTASETYVNRVIVDIRDHTEVELIVPYISRTPWTANGTKTGLLKITVVDALVAPASVANNINILIEIAGGPDFETAVPSVFSYTPTFFTPQSFSVQKNVNTILSETIGSSEIQISPNLATSTCIGDKVSNVRAILKRFYPLVKTGTNPNSSLNDYGVLVVPDCILAYSGTIDVEIDSFSADMISIWASCFTMMSGGFRFRDIIDYGVTDGFVPSFHSSVTSIMRTDIDVSAVTIAKDVDEGVIPKNFHRVYQDCSINNTVTVEVPQYTKTFARCVSDCMVYQSTSMNESNSYNGNNATNSPVRVLFFVPKQFSVTPVANHTLHNVFRAAADDFNLMGFISIPPMIQLTDLIYPNMA